MTRSTDEFVAMAKEMFPFGTVGDAIMLEAMFTEWDRAVRPGSFMPPRMFDRRVFIDRMRWLFMEQRP